jgi:type IV secretory pathway component VirB8
VEPNEQQEIAKKMASGEYFRDARAWYSTLYISPVAERSAFLVLACLAGLVFFIGALSLMDLMPINERKRIIIPNQNMDNTSASVMRLREQGTPLNLSLKKFLAANYVYMRESYRAADYQKHLAFIKEHSDPAAFNQYWAEAGTDNPRSYATLLGRIGERHVQITSVQINSKVEPHVATVQYVTDFKKVKGGTQTAWTATLSFYYTKVSVRELVNPTAGSSKLDIVDPAFNVVSYSVVQSR